MKKLLSCVLVVFILLINVIPCYATNPNLSVGVGDYYVDKNETITVSIRLSADSGLASLSFTVNFNPDEFEYIPQSGATGGLFGSDEVFTPSNIGKLTFSGASTEGVTAGGTVLSFKLKSKLHGGTISLSVSNAADNEGNILIWDSRSKQSSLSLSTHGKGGVLSLDSSETILAAGYGTEICLWELKTLT